MSIKKMVEVWEIELDHPEQSVMLTLADHADDDGSKVFPSVARIAWRTGYGVRQVQRILKRLRDDLHLIQLVQKGGGRGKPSEYKLTLENGDKKTPFNEWARQQKGDTAMSKKGDTAMTPEPSLTTRKDITPKGVLAHGPSTNSNGTKENNRTEQQLLTDQLYNGLRDRYKVRLTREEYGTKVGQFEDVLTKDEPTDQELDRMIKWMIETWPQKQKTPQDAIAAVRLKRDTGEAWDVPAPWEQSPNGNGRERREYDKYDQVEIEEEQLTDEQRAQREQTFAELSALVREKAGRNGSGTHA